MTSREIDSLPFFSEQTTDCPPSLGDHAVHLISPKFVARVNANWELWDDGRPCEFEDKLISNFERLFDIVQCAYKGGVPVPRPIGVFRIILRPAGRRVETFWKKSAQQTSPGLVVEVIRGVPYNKISKQDRAEAKRQLEEGLKKAISLGIRPADTHPCGYEGRSDNVRWDEKTKKLYFVDFGDWSKK